jgi:hypothetical protein
MGRYEGKKVVIVVPGKKRVITAAGVEAAQAPLIGYHQLTVGSLHFPGTPSAS